ncbi:MAG TPA: hypothetical protein VES64_04265 [Allosphingosinicella sp.]|nr:hypothetical protein [Allosphingosinicella sp.]
MRFLAAAAALLAPAAPVLAQELGARTTSPAAMVAQMNRASPEDEMRQLVAAAEAHPLGTGANPVRVGGPEGERAYLGHLRCPGGPAPRIGARREAGVGAFGSVVVAYEVTCGVTSGRIVFDMYHEEHVETRAPAGFTLVR